MTSHSAEVVPPFLLGTVGSRGGAGVAVIGDAGGAVIEMAVHGDWSTRLGDQVTSTLRRCLAGPSVSIILDLQHVADPYGVSVEFWLTAWRWARLGSSPVRLLFCLPVATALSRRLRSRQGPQPRVFATVPEARAATAERADRLQARLAPRPGSVRAARDLVAQACRDWGLPHLLPDSALIVSELAANAVEHARTEFVVTVSRSGPRLHLAVQDGVTRFPQSVESPRAERGRGLQLMQSVAAAWGAMPTRSGKVVWATISPG